jgi:hypothetical protein
VTDLYANRKHALIEGDSFVFPEASQGKITVTRSRWKMVNGTAEAGFTDPTAAETDLHFSSFGFVELVHDVAVAYDWEDEHSEMVLEPEKSCLYGRFSFQASCEFKQFPPGIIFNTSRYLAFKTIDLEINDEKRIITGQPTWYCPVEPPVRLAESVLFPDSNPIVINAVIPIAIRRTATSYAYLPDPQSFRILMKYDKPEQSIKDEIPCRVYFVAGDIGKLKKLRVRDEWDDFFGYARPLTDWLGVKAYPNPTDLVQVEIDPETPEVYEGQDFKFTGKITPKDGLGTGEFTATTKTLDLLDGYQAQKLESLIWNSKILPDEQAWKNSQGFTFDFKPKDGTGTYEVIASTVVEVKEVDTKSVAKATAVASTTALVKPGLKLYSPVDRFFYPLGHPIRVETSMDEDVEEWSKIRWTLNGQQWFPESIGPKPVLKLEKPGDYVLKAAYKTSDGIELSQEITFCVKPAKVSILPERKVLTFSQGLVFSLQGKLDFDGKVLEDSEKPLDLGNGVTAKVTKVDWSAVTNPSEGVGIALDKNLLKPDLKFNRECAITALATVSVSISKTVKTQPGSSAKSQVIEETYVFPAVRADLWAYSPITWSPLSGTFPNEAILGAGRTFSLKSGEFSFQGKKYVWSPETDLNDPVLLSPALPIPEFHSPMGKKIHLEWYAPDSQTSSQAQFTPIFKNKASEVTLNSFLSFADDGKFSFVQKKEKVTGFPLEDMIDYYIDPPSFVMTIGETLPFSFAIKSRETLPPDPLPVPTTKPKKTEIPLLNGAYKLTLENVDWSYLLNNQPSESFSGVVFPFNPKATGHCKIFASATCWLEEISIPAKIHKGWLAELFGLGEGPVEEPKITFFVNDKPLGSETYYLGQKVDLAFKAFNHIGKEIAAEKPVWKIDKPVITHLQMSDDQRVGVPSEILDFHQASLSFCLYDYDTNAKGIKLAFYYANLVFSKNAVIEYSKPVFLNLNCPATQPEVLKRAGEWLIGYPFDPPGITFNITMSNPVSIPYEIRVAQLVNEDCERKLSSDSFQYLQTTPVEKRSPSTVFWLDKAFPVDQPWELLPPGSNQKVFQILWDSPSVKIESASHTVTWVLASATYHTFILARPDPNNFPDSIYCPINTYQWSWGGQAEPLETSWKPVPGSLFINTPQKIPNYYPNWKEKSYSYLDDPIHLGNPHWRKGPKIFKEGR